MRFTVIVQLDTERTPQEVIGEIVSNLELEVSTNTTVDSVVVLFDDEEVAVYDRNKEEK